MDVVQTIDTARREMAAGNDKQAARLLTEPGAGYRLVNPGKREG